MSSTDENNKYSGTPLTRLALSHMKFGRGVNSWCSTNTLTVVPSNET